MENYKSPVNILLVEDSAADVALTQEAFKQWQTPVRLIIMSNGLEALSYLRNTQNSPPALILLDLNLPHWSGKGLLREIKGDGALKKIPVIILTTSNSNEDVMESYGLHANSYVVKPLDIDQFFQKIKHIEAFWLGTALLPTMV